MKMKITIGLTLVVCLLAPCVRAQISKPLTPAQVIELREMAKEREIKQEELYNLEQETARALLWSTGTFFRRVYSDEFVGVLPAGQIKDKAGWISAIENSGIKYSSFVATDIRVHVFEETAVVTCLWSSRGTQGGRPFYRQSRVTHVYVYSQRGWQVIASQETLLPG
ncbi:MAG TPA: nuclear transport factor 2 family protein [Candidatus Limnocylindrales bacterium]|nr:nuclear transport factor 2 family protein [Candidatus Limnocylindrales bacterium]